MNEQELALTAVGMVTAVYRGDRSYPAELLVLTAGMNMVELRALAGMLAVLAANLITGVRDAPNVDPEDLLRMYTERFVNTTGGDVA